MDTNKTLSKGFTFIELILVMTVIGVLAGLLISTYPAAQKSARDTKRKSDIKQYQNALEIYANSHAGLYPVHTASNYAADGLCTALGLGSTCAKDQFDNLARCTSSTCRYYYQSNGTGTQYVLWSRLENPKLPSVPNFYVCSNGTAGESNYLPPTSAGDCP